VVPRNAGLGDEQPRRHTLGSDVERLLTPSLLGCLAGDAEASGDLGPRVTGRTEPGDGLADRVVQVGGQAGHVGQGVNVTGRDPAGVARRTRRMNAAYSSFPTDRRRRFGVKPPLTPDRLAWGPPMDGWSVMTGLTWCHPCSRSARHAIDDR
jgi:hypothetical protein